MSLAFSSEDKRPKAAILMPSGDSIKPDTTMSLLSLCLFSSNYVALAVMNKKGGSIPNTRNILAEQALSFGAEWLMWFDADNTFPAHTLMQLLGHGLPIVGATYRKRIPPYERIGGFVKEPDEDTKLAEMLYMPHGVFLVKSDVYEKIEQPWYIETITKNSHTGSDVHFCNSARAAGYRIMCDMELTRQCGHVGEVVVGWETRSASV